MSSGWFVFTVVASIVICAGSILAAAIMRAAWVHNRREALTSSDLRALEESALILIEQIRSEVDRGIAELEERSSRLRSLIDEADNRFKALHESVGAVPDPIANNPSVDRDQVLELASSGMECTEIARATGLGCGEVKLMVGLSKSR